MIHWKIPVRTVSEANCNQNRWVKKKRRDGQKNWVLIYFLNNKEKIKLPCKIKLIRHGRKEMDDDNLPVSLKYIRDAIADHIITGLAPGRADGDKRLSWEYSQIVGKTYAVEVIIRSQEEIDDDLH